MTSEYAIETSRLCKRFGNQMAVDDLDLQVAEGTVFGFIGPNGAGKSTTIKMLMGLLRSTSGQARVLGFDSGARSPAMRQRVGYVPELHTMYRWMRVGDAISFCRSLYDVWNDRQAEELLQLFELDPRAKIGHLSKGMQAKLALLLAIAHEPELLILDEPTGGLDPLIREEFLDGVLRSICRRSHTVLFSSHMMSDVQRLADTVGIIYEGRLVESCSTENLLSATKRIRAVLANGCDPAEPAPGTLWQQTRGREWLLTVRGFTPDTISFLQQRNKVESIEVMDLGLEDIFKDLVKGRRMAA